MKSAAEKSRSAIVDVEGALIVQLSGSVRSTVTPALLIVTLREPLTAVFPVAPDAPLCSSTPLRTMVVSPPSLTIQSSPSTSATRRPSRFRLTWSFGAPSVSSLRAA